MTWLDLLEGSRQVVSTTMDLVAIPVLIYFLVVNTSLLVLMGPGRVGVPAPEPPYGLRRS